MTDEREPLCAERAEAQIAASQAAANETKPPATDETKRKDQRRAKKPMTKEAWIARELAKRPVRSEAWRDDMMARLGYKPTATRSTPLQ